MTEGEKNCGLSSFLPMSCRGRAEAFARRLHSRLRTLGSQDGEDTYASESSWLASNELSGSVTSLQPRHSTDNDLFMDFGIFDTPGSPEEEVTESELTKFITNPKDNLHLSRMEDCQCVKTKRSNSIDSDSSDGPYYDPEDSEHLLHNHMNGISSLESEHNSEDSNHHESPQNCVLSADSCLPSSSCTSTLSLESRNPSFSTEDATQDETETLSDNQSNSIAQKTSGWEVTYEPQNFKKNNNLYSAIDFETLKNNIESNFQDVEDSITIDSEEDTYSSKLDIEQSLIVECPDTPVDITETEDFPSEKPEESISIEDPTNETISIEEPTNEISSTEEPKEFSLVSKEEPTKPPDENHLKASNSQNFEDETEERTPRIRRCSSLKTGKTPPGTPGRKKIVRFADVLGLDLADVRTFMDEIPKIPTSAYDDLSDVDISLSLSDTSLCSNASPLDLHQPKPTKLLMPLFQQPGGESNFLDRVREQQVCLENAVVHDLIALSVKGTVRVRNLDFNKSVHIRYTMDSWKTFADLQATYVENSCDGFSDKFSFTLYVHTMSVGQKLEFAVRFHCKGCQYWDNNCGLNYCFDCLPTCVSAPYVPITVPEDRVDHWAGAAFYYIRHTTHDMS